MCAELHLNCIASNEITPGGHDIVLTDPVFLKSIRGDSNCMFSSFSYIITGSEDQHSRVQDLIIEHIRFMGELLWTNQICPLLQHLRRIGEVRWVRNVSPEVEWDQGIQQYIAASRMDRDST